MISEQVSKRHTEAAEMIGNNDDILINILVLLPEKSLMRFRNVSKQWCSLISSPFFADCLDRRSIFPSALFLRIPPSSKNKYHFLSLDGNPDCDPFKSLPAGFKILQSCNGLLLCCSNKRCYHIYNPTTNKYTTLPKPVDRTINTIFGVNLAFDPSRSLHYKVVFVRSSNSCTHLYQLEIYSSETQSWSLSREISKFNFNRGVYCRGSIHWMCKPDTIPKTSLCFNVDEETFKEIPMPAIPESWGQNVKCRYFGELGGRLHLILTNKRDRTRQFDVYEMERDFSRWFLRYEVDLSDVISAYPEMTLNNSSPTNWDHHTFRVLAVVFKGSEGSFMVLHVPDKAISYSFKDKTTTLLHDFAPGCTYIDGCTTVDYEDAYPYMRTYASV